jgi:hypothetical protein
MARGRPGLKRHSALKRHQYRDLELLHALTRTKFIWQT